MSLSTITKPKSHAGGKFSTLGLLALSCLTVPSSLKAGEAVVPSEGQTLRSQRLSSLPQHQLDFFSARPANGHELDRLRPKGISASDRGQFSTEPLLEWVNPQKAGSVAGQINEAVQAVKQSIFIGVPLLGFVWALTRSRKIGPEGSNIDPEVIAAPKVSPPNCNPNPKVADLLRSEGFCDHAAPGLKSASKSTAAIFISTLAVANIGIGLAYLLERSLGLDRNPSLYLVAAGVVVVSSLDSGSWGKFISTILGVDSTFARGSDSVSRTTHAASWALTAITSLRICCGAESGLAAQVGLAVGMLGMSAIARYVIVSIYKAERNSTSGNNKLS